MGMAKRPVNPVQRAKVVAWLEGAAKTASASQISRSVSAAVPGILSAMRQGQPGQWASDHRVESEQFSGWNYLAINAIGKAAMSAKVDVFQEPSETNPERVSIRKSLIGRDNSVPVDKKHRFLKLITRPSAKQSGASFRYEQMLQLLLTGQCIIWRWRNPFGLTVERYVLPTAVCQPIQPYRGLPNGGFRVQPVGPQGNGDPQGFVETFGYHLAVGQVIDVNDCIIVRLPHPFVKGDGYSPTTAVSSWIDTAKMVDRSRWNHMHNGPSPSLLVSPPKDTELSTDAEVREYQRRLNAQYAGVENHGKIMVGTYEKVSPLSTTPKEMMYEDGFDQLGKAILAAYSVSPAALGIQESMTYGALAAALKGFGYLAVQPFLSFFAEEDTAQQAPEFGTGLTAEYTAAAVDDPDLTERQLTTDISAKAITVGEVRLLRGRPLFGDERDDLIAGTSKAVPAPAVPAAQPADNAAVNPFAAPDPFGITNDGAKSLRSYGCLMAAMPADVVVEIVSQAQAIPSQLLAGDGIEHNPHLTVKYGLLTNNPMQLTKLCRALPALKLKIGELTYFSGDGHDVLIYQVDSSDAVALHDLLCSSFPHVETHNRYRPHITLAYMKPGTAKEFIGQGSLTGREIRVSKLTYSTPSDKRFVIPLGRDWAKKSLKRRLSTFDRLAVSANGHGKYP